ncbi:hypothetical protein DPMN_070429 [Dreissena polymorpha]|uniref:Uncharacterized protein n=1 Tax=Dreissena polymorpha TaxID=45954 RepID=A0A9D3Z2Y5_DREPO|nr:hypothetical protein DPMN_070429 [Dreissena polymorpha]
MSPCMQCAPGSNPGLSTYHLSERTLIQVLVLAPDKTNAGFIADMASAQTGVRSRTPIACEASSHSGTRNKEMLLTEQVLISATGRLEGECSILYVSDGCLVRVPV